MLIRKPVRNNTSLRLSCRTRFFVAPNASDPPAYTGSIDRSISFPKAAHSALYRAFTGAANGWIFFCCIRSLRRPARKNLHPQLIISGRRPRTPNPSKRWPDRSSPPQLSTGARHRASELGTLFSLLRISSSSPRYRGTGYPASHGAYPAVLVGEADGTQAETGLRPRKWLRCSQMRTCRL